MILIWVHKKDLDKFVKILNNLDAHEELEKMYYTYVPRAKPYMYVQLLINYEEYKELEIKTFEK